MNRDTFKKISQAITATGLMTCAIAATAEPVEIHLLSATVKDQAIGEAEVLLQKNGQQSAHGYSDSDGNFHGVVQFSGDDPAATLIIRKTGYSTLVAKCPCNKLSYAISPVMQQLDGLRIVLNWGATPLDLDAHLVYPGQHVYWNAKQGDEAELDIDHTTGFGPETITIQNRHPGQRYVYAVHDYIDRQLSGSSAMELGRPQVRVYVGQTLVRSYTIDPDKKGNLWSVFAITESGNLEDLDQYADVDHPGDVAAALAGDFSAPLLISTRSVSVRDRVPKDLENVAFALVFAQGAASLTRRQLDLELITAGLSPPADIDMTSLSLSVLDLLIQEVPFPFTTASTDLKESLIEYLVALWTIAVRQPMVFSPPATSIAAETLQECLRYWDMAIGDHIGDRYDARYLHDSLIAFTQLDLFRATAFGFKRTSWRTSEPFYSGEDTQPIRLDDLGEHLTILTGQLSRLIDVLLPASVDQNAIHETGLIEKGLDAHR